MLIQRHSRIAQRSLHAIVRISMFITRGCIIPPIWV
ncbi:Protein of unknown function [Pyronema omphalodes CBS 100304]|uniref:Uncharacterized protein n=1 Tax=Pyronema omphalodes (strain CBS 100304) TaxID=1076935 RepID=U4LJF0_PYROM|nr:Protein of unknown function [Pyronema omphalodes CBS 100304]